MSDSLTPVVVPTAHRGIFFGYTRCNIKAQTLTLENCRMCIYYPSEVRGVVGLAERGPVGSARVTPKVDSAVIHSVTSAMLASEAAVEAWEAEPWT